MADFKSVASGLLGNGPRWDDCCSVFTVISSGEGGEAKACFAKSAALRVRRLGSNSLVSQYCCWWGLSCHPLCLLLMVLSSFWEKQSTYGCLNMLPLRQEEALVSEAWEDLGEEEPQVWAGGWYPAQLCSSAFHYYSKSLRYQLIKQRLIVAHSFGAFGPWSVELWL